MPLARDQLGVVLLSATYFVLAAICGAALSARVNETTPVGVWIVSCLHGVAIGVAAAEAAMLACWQAMRKSTVIGWGASLLALTLICYAFPLGGKFLAHSYAQSSEFEAVATSVFAGICFFVVYAYLMPLAAFWQWRLVAANRRTVQRSLRRLTLGQMFGWTLAVTLPFGVSSLFISDQTERWRMLGSLLGLPLLLLIILPVTFAAFDLTRSRRRVLRSLFWLIATVIAEWGLVAALLIADRGGFAAMPAFNWTTVVPTLLMIASLNVTCYLVAMFSSLWLRRCGYSFVVTSKDVEPQEQTLAV